jgi:hypothetical protein
VTWKANGKTTTLLLFLDSLFLKIKDKCKMLPLEKQQSESKLFHHSALPGGGRGFPLQEEKRGRRRKQLLDDVKEKGR